MLSVTGLTLIAWAGRSDALVCDRLSNVVAVDRMAGDDENRGSRNRSASRVTDFGNLQRRVPAKSLLYIAPAKRPQAAEANDPGRCDSASYHKRSQVRSKGSIKLKELGVG